MDVALVTLMVSSSTRFFVDFSGGLPDRYVTSVAGGRVSNQGYGFAILYYYGEKLGRQDL
jgi:hypothetical protein